MSLPNNYFATRTKPYAVIESDLDTINNYLNQIADEVRPVSRGGTGISAYTIGDIPYASATTALSVIALATDGHYLTSNGTIPQYRQIVQNEISGLGDTETPTFDEVTTTTKVKTDTIEELTPAAGVTVDGIILKDGGATMAAPIIMAGFKITGLGAPNIGTDAATKEYSDALLRVYDWTKSVKDILDLTTSEPGFPSTGDRYLNSATGNTNVTVQAVVIHRIYEWNGVNWTEIIPNEGFTTWVEDENKYYTFYTGVNWVQFGTTISHTVLTGIGTNTHDQIDAVIATIGLNTAGDIVTTDAVQTLTNKTISFTDESLSSQVTVPKGGTGVTSIPVNAIMIGNNVDPIQTISMDNSKILIGQLSGLPIGYVISGGASMNNTGVVTIIPNQHVHNNYLSTTSIKSYMNILIANLNTIPGIYQIGTVAVSAFAATGNSEVYAGVQLNSGAAQYHTFAFSAPTYVNAEGNIKEFVVDSINLDIDGSLTATNKITQITLSFIDLGNIRKVVKTSTWDSGSSVTVDFSADANAVNAFNYGGGILITIRADVATIIKLIAIKMLYYYFE